MAVNEKDTAVGMVAYHRHNPERREMKRLYVKPEVRGMHFGDTLVKELIKKIPVHRTRTKGGGFSFAPMKETVYDTSTFLYRLWSRMTPPSRPATEIAEKRLHSGGSILENPLDFFG